MNSPRPPPAIGSRIELAPWRSWARRTTIENCLNDHAQRARLATKDYLAAVRRILKGAASVVDPDALVDQEIDAYITEHLSLCPDAPN